MKSIISKTVLLVSITAILFSFTQNWGGEGFEIYLNNKVVIQQYGSSINDVKNLRLNQNQSNGQLTIKYHHCGRVGKNRIVAIKNEQNKVVKEWHFADEASAVAAMNCNVKEILGLKKGNEQTFRLHYSSTELPKGRLLANIILENGSMAGNK